MIIDFDAYTAWLHVKYSDTGRTCLSLKADTNTQVMAMAYGLLCDLMERDILSADEITALAEMVVNDTREGNNDEIQSTDIVRLDSTYNRYPLANT